MIFAITLAAILCYLFVPLAGFLLMGGTVIALSSRRGVSLLESQLQFSIITIPLYMTSIVPGVHMLFSWTSVTLVCISITCLAKKIRISPVVVLLMIAFTTLTMLTTFIRDEGIEKLYYSLQLLILVIPVLLVFSGRKVLASEFNLRSSSRLLMTTAAVIAAMSMGVITQWALHTWAGIAIGYVSQFGPRTVYDLTIPAFSILSGILAVGIVLGPTLWRKGRRWSAVVLPLLSVVSIIINSSRTGLLAGAFVVVISVLWPPRGINRDHARMAIIPISFMLWLAYRAVLSSPRFSTGTEVGSDNGRFDNWAESLGLFLSSAGNIVIGSGYGELPFISPHNSIVETLVRSGLPVAMLLIAATVYLLSFLRGSEWFYPILCFLVGSMFYSGFYAVKAFTAVAIIMIILKTIDDESSSIIKLSQQDARGGARPPDSSELHPECRRTVL